MVAMEAASTTPDLQFSMTQGSRLKPPLPFEPCLPDPAKVAAKAASILVLGGALAPNLSSRPQRVLVKAVPATLNLRLR
jgi:hypothetical protein